MILILAMEDMSMSLINLTTKNFDETIKSGKTLVDFFADWCGPCKMLSPIIKEIADEVGTRAVVAKVDVDEQRDLAVRYKVSSIPTVIFFENGAEIKRFEGVRPKEMYLALIGE